MKFDMVKWKYEIKWKGDKKHGQGTWNRWGCTHTHTHTSQFLNERNAIALSYEGVFCVAGVCAESVASVFEGILFFVNYIEDS